MRRGAPHCFALQPCSPQKKKGGSGGPGGRLAGRGRIRRAGDPPRPPPARDRAPSEPSELSDAVVRNGVLFRKMKNTTFR